MPRLTTLSIRSLQLLIICVVALPAAGIILYSGIQFRNEMLNETRKETIKLTDRIVTEQQNLVVGAEQLMTALAQLPEVKNHDSAKVEPILRELRKLNPMYSNIFIADRQGAVWATAVPVKPPFVVADRRYFKNALTSGQLSSGEYVVSRATTMPAFNLAYPLKDARGTVIGVISVGFLVDQYRQLLKRMKLPAETSFVLVDHQGIIISRAINPEPYLGKAYPVEVFQKMKEGPDTGTTVRKGIAGDERILSYQKIRLAGERTPYLYVVTGIPVERALRGANRALVNNLALLSSFLVMACAGALLIGKRSIVDRFKLLEDASRRLAAGDLQVRVSELVVGGELGSLGKTFDAMAEQLARREAERLRAEKVLAQNRDLLNETQKLAHMGSWELDIVSNALIWSDEIYRIFEIDPEKFAGTYQAFLLVVHPDDRALVDSAYRKAVREKTPYATVHRLLMPDGRVKIVQERGETEYRDDKPVRTIGSVQDITELKMVEEEQRKLASLVEMSHDFIGISSLEGNVIYLNNAAIALVGLDSAREAYSTSIHDFFTAESATLARDYIMPGLASQGYWHGEAALRHFKTGEVIAVEMTAFTILDEAGRTVAFANVSRDIRGRKAAEDEKNLLTEQLIQAQKMESIGQLAGGVAHDFNNLLTPIIGYSEFLKKDLLNDEKAVVKVDNILKAADRAKELVQQLLSFSRKRVMEMKIIDLNRVVSSFYSILRHAIRESIDIRLCLAKERYGIRADRNQIEQIIMNLAVNSQDAIGEHGVVTIETAALLLDDEYAHNHPGVSPGRYLMLAVSDDGCGMDQQTRQRIFEPFFTTKGVGKGTGLGLATVYGIVQQHGGSIWVDSGPDRGTTFKCYFPLVDESPISEQPVVHEQVSLAGELRTVLLVEDNEMVRTLVHELLVRQGLEVLVAQDPIQALEMAASRSLDLLITDVVMPYMTGLELHAKLLESHPGLKVLYMSGYTSKVIARDELLEEGIHYIQKPFAISEFAKRVEMLLTMEFDRR
jgi:two-component system, cell cycle sensor histidine kinase and response regulator CckA